MKKLLAVTAVCLCVSVALGGQPSNKLTFKSEGYSIAPLAEGQKGTMMFLPATDGFAPNVNIQVQGYENGIDAYAALSRQQFKDAGLKVLSERKVSNTTVVFEYSGQLGGRTLHWYARAVQKGASVYLVTATATDSQWANVALKLKACVDSFELLKSEQ